MTNPIIELNKHPLPAEQVEKLVSSKSKVLDVFPDAYCQYGRHCVIRRADGEFLSGNDNYLAITREPVSSKDAWDDAWDRINVASKAITSETEATNFALKYVHEQRLPAWVVEHIANAYSFGQMEEIKRGRAE